MAEKPPTHCPKCGYRIMDEDSYICKKCNAVIPNHHSRWGSQHKKTEPQIYEY
ncbi:hypothetical protein J4410_01655 [Candidatus Woesearchaeota archaeon]|nr:hypothetical protein [Candidatus Woesearchaeota archaeon]